LRIAALAGSEFDSRAVAAVAGLDHETAVNELEIACQIGVVAEVAANTFRFVHSLLRTTLRAEIGPTRAAQVHRDLGGAIERLDLRPTDQRISALAYHFRQAAYGDLCLDEAAEYAKEAGETAIRQFAYEDAARYFLDAATFIERKHRETPTSTELRIRSARALHATGDHASASAQLVDAATTADRHGWTAELAKAAIDMQGVMTAQGRTTTEAIALLEKASQAVESEAPSLHPNVVARLAAAYRFAGRTDDATGAARRAMELAEGSDDPATWTVVSDSVHTVFDSPETITPRIVAATRAINASRSAGLHEELSWELWRRTVDNVDLGQLRDARLDLHQLSSNTTTHKQRFMHQLAVTAGSMMAFIDDQLDLAERLALEAEDLRSELEGDQAEGILGIQMYTIRRAQGRLGELAPVIRTLASSPEGSWGPGLANLYSELGMTEEARHLLEQYVDDTGVGLPKDDRWRLSVSYLADACHAAADATRAATLYQELRPHERTWLSFGGVACVGPAARYLGSLALTMGLTDEARHHLQAAREAAQAADSPRFVLEADRWLARLRAGDK
ncbi:MAG: hypothetical protein OES13_08460, partial [Acidimicrobiia bacterium]|nr:hypothetical protein [Acidimicrobiia bacterium]